MRGFSNKAAVAPRGVNTQGEDELSKLDFARYAPERPYAVVASNKEPAPRACKDELSMLLNLAGKSFGQGFRCLWAIRRVIAVRIRLRLKLAYHRVMQMRFLPWVLAGGGWGTTLGLMLVLGVVK